MPKTREKKAKKEHPRPDQATAEAPEYVAKLTKGPTGTSVAPVPLRMELLRAIERVLGQQDHLIERGGGHLSIEELVGLSDGPLAPILGVTVDQLRTLRAVREYGSAGTAASALDRQQSSVQSQINSLNKSFKYLCGQELVAKNARGKPFVWTSTGERVAEVAEHVLSTLVNSVRKQRQVTGTDLEIATTTFSLPMVTTVLDKARRKMGSSVKFHLRQIRTKDFWTTLRERDAAIVLGGIVSPSSEIVINSDVACIPLNEDRFAILTQARNTRPPQAPDDSWLRTEDLLLPESGIIVDLVERVYGPSWRTELRVAHRIHDIHYGVSLLRTGAADGSMLALRSVAEWAAGGTGRTFGPESFALQDLKAIPVGGKFDQYRIVSGAFTLHASLRETDHRHPLNVVWALFEEVAAEKNSGGRAP